MELIFTSVKLGVPAMSTVGEVLRYVSHADVVGSSTFVAIVCACHSSRVDPRGSSRAHCPPPACVDQSPTLGDRAGATRGSWKAFGACHTHLSGRSSGSRCSWLSPLSVLSILAGISLYSVDFNDVVGTG